MLPMTVTRRRVPVLTNETPVPCSVVSGRDYDFHFLAGRPPDHIVITYTVFMMVLLDDWGAGPQPLPRLVPG